VIIYLTATMLSKVSLVISTLAVVYFGRQFLSYFSSLQQSRRFGKSSPVPSVTIYNSRDSFLFWLLSPWLAPYIEALPFGLGHWCKYSKKDYMWASKGELHREELKSDVWWTVGSGGPALKISDANVVSQITHRWRDFPKPVGPYQSLEIFGPNVVTTEGSDWQRHRKITGPPFNDRNSKSV
jgi:hypothetical protein